MPRIALLGLDGAQLSSLAALDLFDMVNRYSARQYAEREVLPASFNVKVLSPTGKPLRLMSGRSFPVDESVAGGDIFDLVYVGAFEVGAELDLAAALRGTEPVCQWLRRQYEAGALLAASCAGILLLAEAGLLAGRTATAPWWLERPFRRRYPDVELDIARSIAEPDERILCCGSLKSELALAHRAIERIGSQNIANWLAKITLVDPYPDGPQPWSVFSPEVLRHDGLVGRAQHWLQLRFSQKPRLRDLAESLAVSERTLSRRFERSLGMSPREYLQTLRIEAAKQMLTRSSRRVDRIGYLVGYSDAAFFNKIFSARTGLSPSEYRRRHGSSTLRPESDG